MKLIIHTFVFIFYSFCAFSQTYRLSDYTYEISGEQHNGVKIIYYTHDLIEEMVEEYYGYAKEGYLPDQRFVIKNTNVVLIAIPQPIIGVANAYKLAMQSIYGEGAETNRQLTKAAVAIDLSLREDVSADTGIRLQTWFEILNEYWGRGEVWTFPYGEAEYSVTNISEVWEAVP